MLIYVSADICNENWKAQDQVRPHATICRFGDKPYRENPAGVVGHCGDVHVSRIIIAGNDGNHENHDTPTNLSSAKHEMGSTKPLGSVLLLDVPGSIVVKTHQGRDDCYQGHTQGGRKKQRCRQGVGTGRQNVGDSNDERHTGDKHSVAVESTDGCYRCTRLHLELLKKRSRSCDSPVSPRTQQLVSLQHPKHQKDTNRK
mmetsp:Transcript_53033/g.141040  ORF Transcript_53033/g.141040 Transcript_53033/m.141040 type:complete len:200 (+) Transcript_53033:1899-2498(+)